MSKHWPRCDGCRRRRPTRELADRLCLRDGVFRWALLDDGCAGQWADEGWFLVTITKE